MGRLPTQSTNRQGNPTRMVRVHRDDTIGWRYDLCSDDDKSSDCSDTICSAMDQGEIYKPTPERVGV